MRGEKMRNFDGAACSAARFQTLRDFMCFLEEYARSAPDSVNFNDSLGAGPQNHSGQCVFDCVPAEGVIPAGSARDVTVTFAPDHPSDRVSDRVRIELFGQVRPTCGSPPLEQFVVPQEETFLGSLGS